MTERMTELGFKAADIKALEINPFKNIGDRWMLITAGDENDSNTMTASWGGLGVMWGKNVAIAARTREKTWLRAKRLPPRG